MNITPPYFEDNACIFEISGKVGSIRNAENKKGKEGEIQEITVIRRGSSNNENNNIGIINIRRKESGEMIKLKI